MTPNVQLNEINNQQNEKDQQMIFLLGKVKKAIIENDISMYPIIQQLIISNIPEQTYEQIITKQVSTSVLVDQIKSYIPEIDTINGKNYLENFIDWAKSQEVVGKCNTCQNEFTYLNEDNLNQNKTCPSCKVGMVEQILTQNLQKDNVYE